MKVSIMPMPPMLCFLPLCLGGKNDPHVHCKKKTDLKKYMKAKTSLANDNHDWIEEAEYFEQLHIDDDKS